ncbi:MAG: agmatinase [Candidatus Odinarchaeum yellowstonii]|uniref:Agmatinase n=1 Tax=Odinarchaeota yellowstonii (strain LCB_4) TaxID=1841599 RepID=A0AAF0IAX6_ODILC|nr:MAG: agmatinase [Candidatus Odinarchaeum yellowstonii]
MSYRELYCSKSTGFLNLNISYNDAEFIVLGVPLDSTSSYIPGARFGPDSIRRASINIETYDYTTGFDVRESKLADIGDIDVDYSSIDLTLDKITKVLSEILTDRKKPIILGGEHTITLGVCRAVKPQMMICFDAHLDLREEYAGARISHATFMRRVFEEGIVEKTLFIGTRAVSREESKFMKKISGHRVITAKEVYEKDSPSIIKIIEEEISSYPHVYISIDMDVLEPAVAPSVGNPEPGGLSYNFVSEVIEKLDGVLIGVDLTEVTPLYNIDITSIYAAKLIFKAISSMSKSKTRIRR